MAGYVKLFSKILDSTIWAEDSDTRILWVTMLAMADRDGVVESTIPGLARRAQISLEKTEAALERFQNPDKYSWSPDQEGRRVERVDRGWSLINYEKYREMLDADEVREKNRLRQERHRQRRRNVTLRDSNAVSRDVTPVTQNNDMHKHMHNQNQKIKTTGGVVPNSSGNGAPPPPKYTQTDFDERDMRLVAASEKKISQSLKASIGSQTITEAEFISLVCEDVGISVARYHSLKEKQR